MRITDYNMRIRAAEELRKLGRNHYVIAEKIGCSPQLVKYWLELGGLPSAHYLKRLHELGCDIIYIIVGDTHVRS